MDTPTAARRTPSDLELRIGHIFRDANLLEEALTHPSRSIGQRPSVFNNQRLEFLGDAVVGAALAHRVFMELPEAREGDLTRSRAERARAEYLAAVGEYLHVWDSMRFGAISNADQDKARTGILCDAVEAIAGAIYLDAGFETARRAIDAWFSAVSPDSVVASTADKNPKGTLQELLQQKHGNQCIRYETIQTDGPPHRRTFTVEVLIAGESYGRGTGPSKKLAEEAAARAALAKLRST
jgi:ribonuclease-3